MFYYGLEWSSLDSYMQFKEIAEPETPQAGEIRQYAKASGSTNTMCWKNDAGTVTCLPISGGTLIDGSGAANRLAYWTDADTLAAVAALVSTRVLFADSSGLPDDDSSWTFVRDDGGFASIITLGDSTHTGVLNLPAGLTVNIDSDNNDTGALFAIQSNTALRLTGGTRLLTITETGAATFVTTLSVGTGFQIAGAATSGNILRGDGTNFVSSAQSGLDHGSIGGLTDDDHTGYVLVSNMEADRATIVTRWEDLTDGGETTLHSHAAATDHGGLTGLTDDDHSQYALLLGRSGGQILIGGTASGDDLTLKSTSNATKGSIFFGTTAVYDEVNERLGIGRTTPGVDLEVYKSGAVPIIEVIGEWDTASMNVQMRGASYSGSNNNAGVVFRGWGIRGTIASPSASASGDILAQFIGDGYTNAATLSGQAAIRMRANALWAAGSAPTRMEFDLTAPSSVNTFTAVKLAPGTNTCVMELSTPAASGQFNLTWMDDGNEKWTWYKTTANVFSLHDHVVGSDMITCATGAAIAFPIDPAWATFSSTLSAGSGTLTTASITARWRRLGRAIDVQGVISITDKGTANGDLRFTLPVNAAGNAYAGIGRENAVNGFAVTVITSTTIGVIQNYDNSSPIVNSASISFSLRYEAAAAT